MFYDKQQIFTDGKCAFGFSYHDTVVTIFLADVKGCVSSTLGLLLRAYCCSQFGILQSKENVFIVYAVLYLSASFCTCLY